MDIRTESGDGSKHPAALFNRCSQGSSPLRLPFKQIPEMGGTECNMPRFIAVRVLGKFTGNRIRCVFLQKFKQSEESSFSHNAEQERCGGKIRLFQQGLQGKLAAYGSSSKSNSSGFRTARECFGVTGFICHLNR
jgi:hypothetical protein